MGHVIAFTFYLQGQCSALDYIHLQVIATSHSPRLDLDSHERLSWATSIILGGYCPLFSGQGSYLGATSGATLMQVFIFMPRTRSKRMRYPQHVTCDTPPARARARRAQGFEDGKPVVRFDHGKKV